MTPETMQAIKIVSVGNAEIQTVPLPKLLDHYILVKVQAVAINPTDW
jgi:NADPH:quinone reductase-like Zn-dependent oxidoreductase